jgi:hypothetical protein
MEQEDFNNKIFELVKEQGEINKILTKKLDIINLKIDSIEKIQELLYKCFGDIINFFDKMEKR